MRLILLIVGSLLSLTSYGLEVQESGNVRWVTGGVGQQERQQIQTMAKDFNLSLLFSSTEGHFFGSAKVLITDSANNTVMDSQAKGPYFFVELPEGDYQVAATLFEQTQTKSLSMPATGRREMAFRWDYKDEPAEIVPRKETVIMIRDGKVLPPAEKAENALVSADNNAAEQPPENNLESSTKNRPESNGQQAEKALTGLFSSLVQYGDGATFGIELLLAPTANGLAGLLQCANGNVDSAAVEVTQSGNSISFDIPAALQSTCLGKQFQGQQTDNGLQASIGEQQLFLPKASSFWNR